jgi:hypothetical protein
MAQMSENDKIFLSARNAGKAKRKMKERILFCAAGFAPEMFNSGFKCLSRDFELKI